MKIGTTAQRALSITALLAALGLLAFGATRSYNVIYEEPGKPIDPTTFNNPFMPGQDAAAAFIKAMPKVAAHEISDFTLIEAATFTGVVREDDQLFIKFDPTQPRGKLACPT